MKGLSIESPRIPRAATHAIVAAIGGLLVYAAAGPLATDDLWWHLSLGQLYAEQGLAIDVDPRLHTSVEAPAPNAWLFDLALFRLSEATGLDSLRVLHVGSIVLLLALLWVLLRRESQSALFASLGCGFFVAISAYRLLQLRPSLLTILASIGICFVVTARPLPSWKLVGLSAALCGLWANLHPGYPLGPGLLLAAAGAVLLASLSHESAGDRLQGRRRAIRLGIAGLLALLATAANPLGFSALSRYATAGVGEIDSALVIDEWRALTLLSWPTSSLPPTPAAWACSWLLIGATLVSGAGLFRRSHLGGSDSRGGEAEGVDAGLLGLALLGLVGGLLAVRFFWMNLFVLLWLAHLQKIRGASYRVSPWLGMGVAVALLWGVVQYSGWTIFAPRGGIDRYRQTFDADRYHAHTVWFLRDSGVEGKLYNAYSSGGFLEYWLLPKLSVFLDGSLNFPSEVLADYETIQTLGGRDTELDPSARLEAYGVDFFVGIGLPIEPRPGRPWRYTTSHLARHPDWLLVYRSLRGAVYLRRSPRNDENLSRIERYYDRHDVPFDRVRGLDVDRSLSEATEWAIEHGMAPFDFPELVQASRRAARPVRRVARDRLAGTYAALGLPARALEIDGACESEAGAGRLSEARERRRIWSWMQLDRPVKSVECAEALARRRLRDRVSLRLIEAAYAYASTDDPQLRARVAAVAPLLTAREAGALRFVQRPPPIHSR